MDDKDKINQLGNNQRNFKRENDRANSTYQRLIKELNLKKKWNHKNAIFDQVDITVSLNL